MAQVLAGRDGAPALAALLADLLATREGVTEVRVLPDGHLLLEVAPADDADLLALTGTGTGDPMPLRLGGGVAAFGPPSFSRTPADAAFHVLHAHARLATRCRTAAAAGVVAAHPPRAELLRHDTESALVATLLTGRDALERARRRADRRPWVSHLREVAGAVHAWCDACPSRPPGDHAVTDTHRSRSGLDAAARTRLRDGLAVLDIEAPTHL